MDVYNLYKKIKNSLNSYQEDLKKFEDLYFNRPKDSEVVKGVSEVSDPILFEIVEHETSHLVSNIPDGEVIPAVEPVEPSDEKAAQILTLLLKHQLKKESFNFLQTLQQTKRTSLIYGTAYVLVTWEYNPQKNIDNPKIELLNPYRCYPDIEAKTDEEMRYFFYEDYVGLQELLDAKLPNGKPRYNETVLKDLVKNHEPDLKEKNAYQQLNIDFSYTNKIKIIRCFTPDVWYVLTDKGEVLERIPNPYNGISIPVVILRNITYPNMFFGLPEAYFVESIIRGMNQSINLRLANVKTILEPKYKARAQAYMNYSKTWINKPDQIFIVDELSDIEPFLFPDVTAGTFMQMQNLFADALARRLGRTDFITRNESLAKRSATEISIMHSEQNARKRIKILELQTFLNKLIVNIIKLNQQFVKQKTVFRITEPNKQIRNDEFLEENVVKYNNELYFEVKPEDIQGEFDFKITSMTNYDTEKNMKLQTLDRIINIIMQSKDFYIAKGFEIDLEPIIKSYFAILGNDNYDLIFKQKQNEQTTNFISQESVEEPGMGDNQGIPPVPEANLPEQIKPAPGISNNATVVI